MNLDILFVQFLNGLVISMLLFLTAAGLSLILGLMDVINLVHGSAYLLGGYLGLTIVRQVDSFWLALIMAPILTGFFGLLIEKLFLQRLYRKGHLHQVLFTFGLALVAADLMRWNWGSHVLTIPAPPGLSGTVLIAGIQFPVYRLFILLFGLVLAAGLWFLIERTRVGAIVRAGVADSQMVDALGIDIQRVFTAVFALGTALAALAGVLAAPVLNLYPGLDSEILLLAMVVVVVGGLGTVKGAFWGAIVIGMADTFAKARLPAVSVFIIFLIMALVLLIHPSGLLGRRKLN